MNKEIGGYIQLDKYSGALLHEDAVALNCGRNALVYVIRSRGITKIMLPLFICDSVTDVCKKEGVDIVYYNVGSDLMPSIDKELADDAWIYIVNYYGQLSGEDILRFRNRYKRIIVDQAQSYFQMPVSGVDTLYSCRKYFGVADGAFLYTDTQLGEDLPQDESYDRMRFLLGRFERSASEFYPEYVANNALFADEPVKSMSKLTMNLLHGINYAECEKIRKENFEQLHECLCGINRIEIRQTGTFMYPLLIEGAAEIRKVLQKKKIYIPVLWPAVLTETDPKCMEHYLAENILPLPIDQRYGKEEMDHLIIEVKNAIG